MRSPSPANGTPATTADDGHATIDQSRLQGLLGYQLTRAEVSLHRRMVERLDPFALRPAEFSILLLVEANIGINQSQIGEALGVSPPNLVAVITRLIKRRLLRRSQSRQDRRVHHLHLTPAGAELLAQAVVEVDAFEADLSASLTAQELRVLRKALAKVSAR
ncbi:MarR family winged helix-turn-helix transcriptional regulator [Luteimonas sp. RIT-PG2_3]|jgi:DNA-binding MarR family transcriptional regulator